MKIAYIQQLGLSCQRCVLLVLTAEISFYPTLLAYTLSIYFLISHVRFRLRKRRQLSWI